MLAGLDDEATKRNGRSLLTCKRTDRTLRFDAPSALSPKDVMKACKALGSGKLGVVRVLGDGTSAAVDVPASKLDRLLANADAPGGLPAGWALSLPDTLDAAS